MIHGDRPVELGVDEILRANTAQLMETLQRELELKRANLLEEIHAKSLARIFIENRIYKDIEKCETLEAVQAAVLGGVNKFRRELRRDVTPEDVEALLQLRIKRISLFDLNQNRREIADAVKALAETEASLAGLKKYAIGYLKNLLKTYGKRFPRQTKVTTFGETDARTIAAKNLAIAYDKSRGYLGWDVRGDGVEPAFKCSDLDRILIVHADGRYRVVAPPEKLFVDRDVIRFEIFDRERLYTAVFGSRAESFAKRFAFGGTILNKEYLCIPEKMRLHLLHDGSPERLFVKFREYKLKPGQRKPPKGARGPEREILLVANLPVQNPRTRGTLLSERDIESVSTSKPRNWPEETVRERPADKAPGLGPLFGGAPE